MLTASAELSQPPDLRLAPRRLIQHQSQRQTPHSSEYRSHTTAADPIRSRGRFMHRVANPKASASNQAAYRDGEHVLNLSICCCEETTLGGSRPRRPRRSLSVIENAVPCSSHSQQHQKVHNPQKRRDRVKSGSATARRERPDGERGRGVPG